MSVRFEYMEIETHYPPEIADLNLLGASGWEFIQTLFAVHAENSAGPSYMSYFKRKLERDDDHPIDGT